MSTDIEKEIRSATEAGISSRMGGARYSKEFVDEFRKCCYRLMAPEQCGGISMRDMNCMFGTIGAYKVLEMYSAEKIVKIIREYDKKKELEQERRSRTFCIGDEVRLKADHGHTGLVLSDSIADDNFLSVWFATGIVTDGATKIYYEKTGRHFDSIDYWIKTELRKEEK